MLFRSEPSGDTFNAIEFDPHTNRPYNPMVNAGAITVAGIIHEVAGSGALELMLDRLSRAFGAWLQSLGLAKGARVALMMPNVLQYPVSIFAVLRAGCTVVNVNPLYTARELEYQLKDSGAEAIVILENFANTLQQVIKATPIKHVVIASLGDMLGLKGTLVNLVVRHVKKMVPAYGLPGSVQIGRAHV